MADIQFLLNQVMLGSAYDALKNEAYELLKGSCEAMTKVHTKVNDVQQKAILADVEYPVSFTGQSTNTNGHSEMAARRELTRNIMELLAFGCYVTGTNGRSHKNKRKDSGVLGNTEILLFGCGSMEMKAYSGIDRVYCNVSRCESKDVGRQQSFLEAEVKSLIKKNLQRKIVNESDNKEIKKRESKLFADLAGVTPLINLANELKEEGLSKLPTLLLDNVCNAGMVVMYDSWYNLSTDDLFKIFDDTNTHVIWGVATIPLELFFPTMVESPHYKLRYVYISRRKMKLVNEKVNWETLPNSTTVDGLKRKIGVTFSMSNVYVSFNLPGCCSGYVHSYKNFTKFVDSPVVRGKHYSLHMEIMSMCNPMCVFKITRASVEVVSREITLPKPRRFVRVLNMLEAMKLFRDEKVYSHKNFQSITSMDELYFSVYEDEFNDTINWANKCKSSELTIESLTKFITNRMLGVSLVTQSSVCAWELAKEKVLCLGLVTLIIKSKQTQIFSKLIESSVGMLGIFGKVGRWFKDDSIFATVFYFFYDMFRNFKPHEVIEVLVQKPEYSIFRVDHSSGSAPPQRSQIFVEEPEDTVNCKMCCKLCQYSASMLEKVGGEGVRQKFDCVNFSEEKNRAKFDYPKSDLTRLRDFIKKDYDTMPEGGLRKVNEKVITVIESIVANLAIDVTYDYINGGPGCGKSEIVKYMIENGSGDYLIMVPFSELASEYVDSGFKNTMTQQTAAVSKGKVTTLFVDEFTSVPLEYLCMTIHNRHVEHVVLVGDVNQCWVQGGQEGTRIDKAFDLVDCHYHRAIVNYRNPKDVVAFINSEWNLKCECAKEQLESIEIIDIKTPPEEGETAICFSRAFQQNGFQNNDPAKEVGQEFKKIPTVRAVQGKTFDNVILYCEDIGRFSNKHLCLVALTRHKTRLRIAVPEGDIDFVTKRLIFSTQQQIESNIPPIKPVISSPDGTFSYDRLMLIAASTEEKVTQCPQTKDNEYSVVNPRTWRGNSYEGYTMDDTRVFHYGNSCYFTAIYQFIRMEEVEMISSQWVEARFIDMLEIVEKEHGVEFLDGYLDGTPKDWTKFLRLYCEIKEKKVHKTSTIVASSGKAGIGTLVYSDNGFYDYRMAYTMGLVSPMVIVNSGTHVEVKHCKALAKGERIVACRIINTVGKTVKAFSTEVKETTKSIVIGVGKGTLSCAKSIGQSKLVKNFGKVMTEKGHLVLGPSFRDFESDMGGIAEPNILEPGIILNMVVPGFFVVTTGIKLCILFFNMITRRDPTYSYYRNVRSVVKGFFPLLKFSTRNVLYNLGFSVFGFLLTKMLRKIYKKEEPIVEYEMTNIDNQPPVIEAEQHYSDDQDSTDDAPITLSDIPLCDDNTPDTVKLDILRYLKKLTNACSQIFSYRKRLDVVVGDTIHDEIIRNIEDGFEVKEGFSRERPIFDCQDSAAFIDHIETCWKPIGSNMTTVVLPRAKQTPKYKNSYYDAYKMAEEILCPYLFDGDIVTSLNLFGSTECVGEFDSGVIKPDLFDNLTVKGNIKKTYDIYYSASVGQGFYFTSSFLMQEVQCVSGRYLNKKYIFPFDEKAKKLAKKIVDMYFEDCMDLQKCAYTLANAEEAWLDYERHCREKHYDSRFQDPELDKYLNVIGFSVKSLFKPKVGKIIDPTKVGQGVSAWNTTLQSFFCGAFRILGGIARGCEKSCVLTDNGYSEIDFTKLLTARLRAIPAVATNAITDGVMFDSQQNEFTQEVEKQFWLKLGVNKKFLHWYYKHRSGYRIVGKTVKGRAKYEKTSGEPATKENNGIVSKVMSNAIVRGSGPFVMVYKGDDFYKRQCGQYVDQQMKEDIESRCPLRLRVELNANQEFCGMIACGGSMGPSIYRRLSKVCGHRFRDHSHFCEYQESIRNFIDYVDELGHVEVLSLNADVYKTEYEHANDALEALKSFGHINQKQFEEMFRKRVEHHLIPTNLDKTGYNVLY